MKIAKQIWTYPVHFCYTTTTSGVYPNSAIIFEIADGRLLNVNKNDNYRKRYAVSVGKFKFKSI